MPRLLSYVDPHAQPLWSAFLGSLLATTLTMIAVARGWTARLDGVWLERLRIRAPLRSDGKPKRLVTATADLMALGGDTLRLLFVAGSAGGLLADHRPRTAGLSIAIFASARAALFFIKRLVRRPRPDGLGHGVVTYTSSFPSGHTFMAVVVFLSAALLIPEGVPAAVTQTAIWVALVGGLMIGTTRIAFGVHWPSDIVAGWLAAIAWTTGCLLLVPA